MASITTNIPARLDGLRWSRFHALLLAALGVSWMLDGLEVTIIGAMGGEYAAVNMAIDELMPARLRGDNRPDKRMAQRDCNLCPPSARLWRGALGSWGWSGNVLRI